MMSKEINLFGENTSCAFYRVTASGRRFCQALRDWYNEGEDADHCAGCPFYKTEKELSAEERKCAARLKRKNFKTVMIA